MRYIGRSADEYTDDEIAEAVLELVASLVDGHLAATGRQEPDRVRAWCPPEARYDYVGTTSYEEAS